MNSHTIENTNIKWIAIAIALYLAYSWLTPLFAQPGELDIGRLRIMRPPRTAVSPPAGPPTIGDSLIAAWAMDNTLDQHASHELTQFNKTIMGDSTGVIGTSTAFNLDSAQYAVATDSLSTMGGSFTATWWDYQNPGNGTARIALGHASSLTGNPWVHFVQSGSMVARIHDGTTRQIPTSDGNAIAWRFHAFTFDRTSDTARYYINGVLKGSAYVPNAVTLGPQLAIGALESGSFPFKGRIDEVYFIRGVSLEPHHLSWWYNSGSARTYTEVRDREI